MLDRSDRLLTVMGPPEKTQRPRVKRLDAERQAIDPGRGEGAEALGLGRIRIGFESDLDIPARPAMRARTRSSNLATVFGGISDGVPPPKNTEPTIRVPAQAGMMVEIGKQRARPRAARRRRRGHGC